MIFMKYELSSDLNLLCLESPKGPLTAEQTFGLLENSLSTLKKKKFYGLSKLENNKLTYLACVKIEDDDNINAPGLQEVHLPKGNYVRERITNWEKNLSQIPLIIDKISADNLVDPERYIIEFYRSEKELFLLIPIK